MESRTGELTGEPSTSQDQDIECIMVSSPANTAFEENPSLNTAKPAGSISHTPKDVEKDVILVSETADYGNSDDIIYISPPNDTLQPEEKSTIDLHPASSPSAKFQNMNIDRSSPVPQGDSPSKRKFPENHEANGAGSGQTTSTTENNTLSLDQDLKRFKIESSLAPTDEQQHQTSEPNSETTPSIRSQNVYSVAPESSETLLSQTAKTPSVENGEKSRPEKLTKRQEERLAKQKLREIERVERERKKEEERIQKKEEREKKELERKQKRELVEKEKQEKREQERLKKEQRRLKMEEEKKAKEQERKAKELERKLKEDERKKAEASKERNQMKISNFFTVKAAPKEPSVPKTVPVLAHSPLRSPANNPVTAKQSSNSRSADAYDADFLPFFQKRNVVLAPHSQLKGDLLETAKSAFDGEILHAQSAPNIGDMFIPCDAILNEDFTSSQQMVDALNSSHMTVKTLSDLVSNLPPIKYLQFYENAKPPYIGTWCSEKHLGTFVPPVEPLNTSSTGFDYDYDSDLDWQEGDEGDEEDIDDLDEGDEEEDEAEDDEMEDFVDNSETSKRGHVGPLQSVSIWNDGSANETFDNLKYERLHFHIDFPIDPFKDYWSVAKEPKDTKELKEVKEPKEPKESKPEPQEIPPQPITSVTQLGTPVKVAPAAKSQTPNVLTPQKPIIKDEKVVESLVEFVKKNSDFSIGTLSELAKKEFKVYTKSILKHTIQEVAFYNKKKSAWEIKSSSDPVV